MKYSIRDIAKILDAEEHIIEDLAVEHLVIDSRKTDAPATSLFFAILGPRRDGHLFIEELHRKGVRNFVIDDSRSADTFPPANYLRVPDTLAALQQLAAHHRRQFSIPVIGITGSNGKTIVKEWLYQLLHEDYNIVRSPKSYNSQIGVPLSVWQVNAQHTLAIFEAGISQQEEMLRLGKIIQPTIGVLTNIGEAHSAGFNDDEHKLREKLTLFRNCEVIIGREEELLNRESVTEVLDMFGDIRLSTWGDDESSNENVIRNIEKKNDHTVVSIGEDKIRVPFTDDASVENAITCYCVLKYLKTDPALITERMMRLHSVNMRLELKKGINHCLVINDSYSADLSSLGIALSFLDQQASTSKRTVILSDFLQSAIPDEELYDHILATLANYNVSRLIGIGPRISAAFTQKETFETNIRTELFPSTGAYIKHFRESQFKEEIILVKGARVFSLEEVVQLLEQKAHQTVLEINLNAIVHNLKEYQRLLKPSTKVMAMVKAFAYGSGGSEIAGILQYNGVDYLGVAYADEGVELRRAGIQLPIMVMNPEERTFDAIVENNLEPELYSFEMLSAFDNFLKKEGISEYPVHIELETGMNRLGFPVTQIDELATVLSTGTSFKVRSVFSHLAASEDPSADNFTLEQFEKFDTASKKLEHKLGYPLIKHISNSAAIVRHPALQLDMVRLGIGL